MKLRVIAYVLAALCLMGTTACGETSTSVSSETSETATAETSEESSEEETTETETEAETEQETDSFVLPELSDEIPAKAVTKCTRTEYSDDKEKDTTVEYLDEHDNSLLRIRYEKDKDEAEVENNEKYEYDSSGEYIYRYELSDYALDEYYYDHDKDNNVTSTKSYRDGKLNWEAEYKYDKYGNLIIDKTTYYEDETGEIMSVLTDDDRSDCDYDSDGNMITVRDYTRKGELRKTYSYTYDADGNMLTEKCVKEKFDPERDEVRSTESVYEYDPVCGKKSFEKNSFFDADGELLYYSTYDREFDSKGRLTKVTIYYSKIDSTETVTYEYEDII